MILRGSMVYAALSSVSERNSAAFWVVVFRLSGVTDSVALSMIDLRLAVCKQAFPGRLTGYTQHLPFWRISCKGGGTGLDRVLVARIIEP